MRATIEWDSPKTDAVLSGEYDLKFTCDHYSPPISSEIKFTFISKSETEEREQVLRLKQAKKRETKELLTYAFTTCDEWLGDYITKFHSIGRLETDLELLCGPEMGTRSFQRDLDEMTQRKEKIQEELNRLLTDPNRGVRFNDQGRDGEKFIALQQTGNMPENKGLVIQLGTVEDGDIGHAIGLLLGKAALDIVVSYRQQKHNLNDFLRNQSGSYRAFTMDLQLSSQFHFKGRINNDGKLSMSLEPTGGLYAVNQIKTSTDDRMKVWYQKLKDALIFRKSSDKENFIKLCNEGRKKLVRCIDLETMEITEANGREQVGGDGRRRPPPCIPAKWSEDDLRNEITRVESEYDRLKRKETDIIQVEKNRKEVNEEMDESKESFHASLATYTNTVTTMEDGDEKRVEERKLKQLLYDFENPTQERQKSKKQKTGNGNPSVTGRKRPRESEIPIAD